MNKMKARRKGTTTEFEVEGIIMNGIGYVMEEVEVIPTVTELSTDPDWEQRRYEIAKDIYASDVTTSAEGAVSCADKLIAELQKQNP